RELLRLRRELGPLAADDPGALETARGDRPPVVWVRRAAGDEEAVACLHFGDADCELDVPFAAGWTVTVDSAEARFAGPGAGHLDGGRLTARPWSFVLLERDAHA